MGKVNFVLKEPKSDKQTLIYAFFYFDKQTFKYSTSKTILPKLWNADKQRAKESRTDKNLSDLNKHLNELENKIKATYEDLIKAKVSPTPQLLRKYLEREISILKQNDEVLLIPFIKNLIETTNKKVNTIKNYQQALRKLEDFENEKNLILKFQDIDLNFYNSFFLYCSQIGLGVNTIGSHIKNLKVFMNEALDRKLHQNLEYKNRKFKTIEEESENIYLSLSEIDTLIELDLSDNSRLSKVRDLFIISCFTGLRYSDLIQLGNQSLIDNRTKIKVKTEKTGEMVIIPLNKKVIEILNKYNGFPEYVISNQKMNEYLKELGVKAKLDEDVYLSCTKNNKICVEPYKKHELITIHTGRRSFATNAFLKGVPTISIMKITGHRTEKAFMKYIKISQADNANKLVNHPFFN